MQTGVHVKKKRIQLRSQTIHLERASTRLLIQAQIVKQNKQKEKKEIGKAKGKGFEKTSDNWKAASEDFRAAVKAMKK